MGLYRQQTCVAWHMVHANIGYWFRFFLWGFRVQTPKNILTPPLFSDSFSHYIFNLDLDIPMPGRAAAKVLAPPCASQPASRWLRQRSTCDKGLLLLTQLFRALSESSFRCRLTCQLHRKREQIHQRWHLPVCSFACCVYRPPQPTSPPGAASKQSRPRTAKMS
jgi:hypothetical protein